MSQNNGEGLSSKKGNQVVIWSWKLNEGIVSRKEWLIEPVGAAGSNKIRIENFTRVASIPPSKPEGGSLTTVCVPVNFHGPQSPTALAALLQSSLSFSSCSASHSCLSPQGVQGPQLANLLGPPLPNTALCVSVSLLSPVNLPDSSLRILYILDVLTERSFNLLPRAVGTKTHLTFESLLPCCCFKWWLFSVT